MTRSRLERLGWALPLCLLLARCALAQLSAPEAPIRRAEQPANALPGQSAFVAILGEVARPGVYELGNHELFLAVLIERVGRLPPQASPSLQLVQNGRRGTQVLYEPNLRQPLANGDVVIVERRAPGVRDGSGVANPMATPPANNDALQTQIALVNVIDRPVVVATPANGLSLARLLETLGQSNRGRASVAVLRPRGAREVVAYADASSCRLGDRCVVVFDRRHVDTRTLPRFPEPIRARQEDATQPRKTASQDAPDEFDELAPPSRLPGNQPPGNQPAAEPEARAAPHPGVPAAIVDMPSESQTPADARERQEVRDNRSAHDVAEQEATNPREQGLADVSSRQPPAANFSAAEPGGVAAQNTTTRSGGMVFLVVLAVASATWWCLIKLDQSRHPGGEAGLLDAAFLAAPDSAHGKQELADLGQGSTAASLLELLIADALPIHEAALLLERGIVIQGRLRARGIARVDRAHAVPPPATPAPTFAPGAPEAAKRAVAPVSATASAHQSGHEPRALDRALGSLRKYRA